MENFSSSSDRSRGEFNDLYDSVYRADLSSIPVDAVGPAGTFGDDYQVHRSIGDASGKGGVEALAPPAFVASKNYLGGARYSPTALPLADTSPLKVTSQFEKYHKQLSELPKDNSGSSDDSTVRVHELPDVPCFLESNNHVYLSGRVEIDQIAHLLEQVFAKCQVDYIFNSHKFKWKAARSKHHINVDFRARVYRCPKTAEFVLEFQKRKGDYFLMRDTFERFLSAAEGAKLVRKHCSIMAPSSSRPASSLDGINSSIQAAFAAACSPFVLGSGVYLPPPSFGRQQVPPPATTLKVPTASAPSKEMAPQSSAETTTGPTLPHFMIKPLMAMAEGCCLRENFEAAHALARLSASEDNRAVLKEAGAIPILVQLIQKTDCPDIKQAVVTALSNLSESASCKYPLVEAGAVAGLLSLVANSEDEAKVYRELEMRRESARTLANLSEEYATAMVNDIGKEAIYKWINSVDALHDERLRMHAKRFKSRVGVCC